MKIEFRRMMYSRGFYTAVLVMVVAQCIGGYEQLWVGFSVGMASGLQYGYFLDVLRASLSSDIMMFLLPVMAALPYSTSFIDDISGGYIRFYLPRKGRGPYIKHRILVNAISGGLCADFAILMGAGLFALLFRPLEILPDPAVREEQILLFRQQCISFLIEKLYLFFVCGCLWATFGALIATMSMSRFLAYLSPFIAYYLLVIVTERYFVHFYILSPKEWLCPQHAWPLGVFGLSLIIFFFWVALMAAWAFLISRRLQDA